jgi:hypothetical protein
MDKSGASEVNNGAFWILMEKGIFDGLNRSMSDTSAGQ